MAGSLKAKIHQAYSSFPVASP